MSRHVVFAGLEHVIAKTLARGDSLEAQGYRALYYSLELTRCSGEIGAHCVYRASQWLFLDAWCFVSLLARHRPCYVEIYYRGRGDSGLRPLLYVVLSKWSGILNFIVLRGELYYLDGFSMIRRYFYRSALMGTNRILYRETHMRETLARLGVPESRVAFDPNKVRVGSPPNYTRTTNVLYLNSIKTWRRVDLLIKAIRIVAESVAEFSVTIVGARNKDEMDYLRELVAREHVESLVRLEPWTDTPRRYYEEAAIFVLPADLVYLNFSLLEAMERGVPPIIADVVDADKIVSDGYDGCICPQDEKALAQRIVTLLNDPDLRECMGRRARAKVEQCFDDNDRMKPIVEAISRHYGANEPVEAATDK